MFRDYNKAKGILKGSFEHILGIMDERRLSYDEIKGLLVETLYQLSKENEKVEEKVYVSPQVLYGPPPIKGEELLYGPDFIKKEEILYGPSSIKESEVYVSPQVLYGPPPVQKNEYNFQKKEINYDFSKKIPQELYAPPKLSQFEIDEMLEDFIPGTTIRRPREKSPNETDDEYLEYLNNYYASFFPNSNGPKAR